MEKDETGEVRLPPDDIDDDPLDQAEVSYLRGAVDKMMIMQAVMAELLEEILHTVAPIEPSKSYPITIKEAGVRVAHAAIRVPDGNAVAKETEKVTIAAIDATSAPFSTVEGRRQVSAWMPKYLKRRTGKHRTMRDLTEFVRTGHAKGLFEAAAKFIVLSGVIQDDA